MGLSWRCQLSREPFDSQQGLWRQNRGGWQFCSRLRPQIEEQFSQVQRVERTIGCPLVYTTAYALVITICSRSIIVEYERWHYNATASRKLVLFIFFTSLKYLFVFRLWWVFIAAQGLSLVVRSGGFSPVVLSHCTGFPCWGARALECVGSVVAAHEYSSCSFQAFREQAQ